MAAQPRRALLWAGGALGAGLGGYFLLQAKDVLQLQSRKQELEQDFASEQAQYRKAQNLLLEQESLIKALLQQSELGRQSAAAVSLQLDDARQQVAQLEAQQQQRLDDVRRLEREAMDATQRLHVIRDEGATARRKASLAQQALYATKLQIGDAKLRLNPLNHPRVKELTGRQ